MVRNLVNYKAILKVFSKILNFEIYLHFSSYMPSEWIFKKYSTQSL